MTIKTYYMLTKPGIILGNVVTTAAGFALASKGRYDFTLFFLTLLGLGLVVASAGVFNNYIDRAMDAKMSRTKDRPLASGAMPPLNAILFASLLGAAGFLTLASYTNALTAAAAAAGFFIYLVLYGFMKYRSFYGTLVGSVAGAMPPVVGYCAVSNSLDTGALLLFLTLVLWQMPHFFAIALYRRDDYAAAAIPALPGGAAKVQISLYIGAFMVTSLMLTATGYLGLPYAAIAAVLGAGWLALSLAGFAAKDEKAWARQMFVYSLVVVMGVCLAVPLDLYGG